MRDETTHVWGTRHLDCAPWVVWVEDGGGASD